MSVFVDLVKHIAALLGFVSTAYNHKVALEGIQECNKGIRKINKALMAATSLGEKQHLLASQRNIKTLRIQFKSLQKQGAGLRAVKETAQHRVHWDDSASAFESRIRTGVISNLKHKETRSFFTDCKTLFRRRIQNALKINEAIKVNTVFCGEFKKTSGEKKIIDVKYFTTGNSPIYKNTDIDQWFDKKIANTFLTELEEFQERDSGWTLTKIINLGININKFTPQLGSSYIELPPQIRQKKACINVRNNDQACFAWAVTSALYSVEKDPQRVSKYPHYSKVLKLKGIQFPVTLKQIPNFEKQNNVSINVYILKDKGSNRFETLPTYLSRKKLEKHVNLLLIQNTYEENDDADITPVKYHYVWIKSLSRLVSSQLSKEDHQKYFCDRCLHYFRSEEKLAKHTEDCVNINSCKIRLPDEKNKFLKFKDFKNKEKTPFIIYADSECLLQPVQNEGSKKTNVYQKHIPYSMGYYIKCTYDDSLSRFVQYTGPDCTEWFTNELKNFAANVETAFLCPLPMEELTPTQNDEYFRATMCHICENPLVAGEKKVRDHCHLTGQYRGPAHEDCNINYQDSHTIPIVFHNLSSYDGSVIIEELAKEGRIDLLPVNKERYISFTKHIPENLVKFRFIDSFRFMASGLSTLASYLEDFPVLKSEFSDIEHNKLKLLTRKGVFPYDYMKSWETLNHTHLPNKMDFYNQLEDKHITDEDYKHGTNVWKTFECKSMQEYSDLYLKTDILLLADVFEQFRKSSCSTYGLDPAHYYTLPGYAWSCMFYKTGIQLELLTDIDMIMFIERGIRGGLSQCTKRRARANNKYMQNYDKTQDSKYLMYFDINNQYGWAMSHPLPTGDFTWLSKKKQERFQLEKILDNSDNGYILEVDLEIPKELHDKLSDLPPCPEHLAPPGSRNKKLLATLYDKKKYIIHYRNLKQAVKLGVKISNIHRILKFRQSTWLKSYIDMNTNLRKNAKNEFEKNLFKLMNNAVFGKTMENIRNHSIVKLVNQWNGRYGAEALISKPQFKSATVFTDTLVAIELNKEEIYFNKPIYVGMCILDLAKTTIYDFHYEYMRSKFDNNCTICYTDTDSLVYEIKTNDIYQIIKEDCKTMFDTSDYPANNVYDIPQVNKKVLGLMKDENNGMLLEEFVGLRSKMYAVKLHHQSPETNIDMDTGVTKKIKGIKKSVIKNKITFEDYMQCLENAKEKTFTQNLITSQKHVLHSITQTKVALSSKDDKRFLIMGSYDTLPWGHYSIME